MCTRGMGTCGRLIWFVMPCSFNVSKQPEAAGSSEILIPFYQGTQDHQAGWCNGNNLDLYSGHARFESQLEHELSRQRFLVHFLSHSR
jgi:hypothetical protein